MISIFGYFKKIFISLASVMFEIHFGEYLCIFKIEGFNIGEVAWVKEAAGLH